MEETKSVQEKILEMFQNDIAVSPNVLRDCFTVQRLEKEIEAIRSSYAVNPEVLSQFKEIESILDKYGIK